MVRAEPNQGDPLATDWHPAYLFQTDRSVAAHARTALSTPPPFSSVSSAKTHSRITSSFFATTVSSLLVLKFGEQVSRKVKSDSVQCKEDVL